MRHIGNSIIFMMLCIGGIISFGGAVLSKFILKKEDNEPFVFLVIGIICFATGFIFFS